MSDPAPRRFTVPPAAAGERLDRFLADRCPDLSRSAVQRAVAAGRVTVDGTPAPSRTRLRPGQQVTLVPLPPPPATAVPQDIPLRVVYEDAHLLVVDKPAGLVVHPAPGHPDGTLVNAVLHHRGGAGALPGEPLRPGLVHRLDRDTSGLLVVALTEAAHRDLAAQLQERTLGRAYHAVCWGRWAEDAGEIAAPLARHPRHRQRMAVVADGRPALTRYRVLSDHGFAQLVEARLATGRTHQIRVHFAWRHHPVVGDPVYGDDRRARGVHSLDRRRADRLVAVAGRQMLHAAWLRLRHPATGETLVLGAPWPDDLRAAVTALGGEPDRFDPGAGGTPPWTG